VKPTSCHLMQRLKWVDRVFQFDIPMGWMPNVLARLAGTEARLREYVRNLSDQDARLKPDDKWSIKEHIGHLTDLESIHSGRLQDFRNREHELRAADMKNVATEKANHNDNSLENLLSDFAVKRKAFIEELRNLDDATQSHRAVHPRLKVLMRPVDMATFTAEHDDHHIASIVEILQKL